MTFTAEIESLEQSGFVLLRGVFDASMVDALRTDLTAALESDQPSVLRSRGSVYGSRDLISLLPQVGELPRQPLLAQFVRAVMGSHAGLVRALYFDKPPDRSWSLPWHKDFAIAVQDNRLPSAQFRRPTLKAGVPHVEAPESLLAEMLTLRIHLDPMTADNGPLSVIPGSHDLADEAIAAPLELHAEAGDVLAMRPLISHSSSLTKAGTTQHRRIVHLELAPREHLPDGYQWHWYVHIAARGIIAGD